MYPYQPQPPEDDGGATTSLIFGIIGIITCGLLSPIALAMGLASRRRIQDSGGRLGGENQALAGIVLGAIGLTIITSAIMAALAGFGEYLRLRHTMP